MLGDDRIHWTADVDHIYIWADRYPLPDMHGQYLVRDGRGEELLTCVLRSAVRPLWGPAYFPIWAAERGYVVLCQGS